MSLARASSSGERELNALRTDDSAAAADEQLRNQVVAESRRLDSAQQKRKRDESLLETVDEIRNQGWRACLCREPSWGVSSQVSLPIAGQIRRSSTPMEVFNMVLSKELFGKLAAVTADAAAVRRAVLQKEHAHEANPTWEQLRRHFLTRLLFTRNRRDALCDYWKFPLTLRNGPVSLPPRYLFEYISSNVAFSSELLSAFPDVRDSMDQLQELVRNIMWSFWLPGANLALDELVIPFSGASPLKAFIERKPHPEGLLAYLLSSQGGRSGKSYILDFAFVDRLPKLTAIGAFDFLSTRVANSPRFQSRGSVRPHIVFDALFGGLESVERLGRLNLFGTGAVSAASVPALIETLSFRLPGRAWRLARRRKNGHVDMHCLLFRDNADVVVASNAMQCSCESGSEANNANSSAPSEAIEAEESSTRAEGNGASSGGFTERDVKSLVHLAKENARLAVFLAERCGIDRLKCGGDGLKAVSLMTGLPIAELERCGGSPAPVSAVGDTYDSATGVLLKAMCKDRGLKTAGNRAELLTRLRNADRRLLSDPIAEMNRLVGEGRPGPVPSAAHLYWEYRKWFNGVDRHNVGYYALEFPHRETDPQRCFVWCLLQMLLSNAWVLYLELHRDRDVMLTDFVDCLLAEEFCKA